jgi:hypothetical protein
VSKVRLVSKEKPELPERLASKAFKVTQVSKAIQASKAKPRT